MADDRSLLDILDDKTTTANSAIELSDGRQAIVQLDPDHPGFRDGEYRQRRNRIAQIAVDYSAGQAVPDAPYTDEEHAVWQGVCTELAPAHQRHACREYLEAKRKLGLSETRIPQLEATSARIAELSGFRLEPVGGLVHPKVFLATMARGAFLCTQYIRHYSSPSYTPEPDVVHELIGHAVQLASPLFGELSRLVGRRAEQLDDGGALERLSRVYWFTLEFGVLREEGQLKAYGSGLLSSYGELEAMHKAELRPFDPASMEQQSYDVTEFQPILYCAESIDQLREEMRRYLA